MARTIQKILKLLRYLRKTKKKHPSLYHVNGDPKFCVGYRYRVKGPLGNQALCS